MKGNWGRRKIEKFIPQKEGRMGGGVGLFFALYIKNCKIKERKNDKRGKNRDNMDKYIPLRMR